jgi:hypothetical protein
MTWHRQTNFHNSRNYDDEERKGIAVSQARLTLAWLIETARRKFRITTKPVPARQPGMVVVKLGNGKGFTVLGSAIAHHAAHESAMTCPFPEQDDASARLRSAHRSAASRQHNEQRRSASDPSAPSSGL